MFLPRRLLRAPELLRTAILSLLVLLPSFAAGSTIYVKGSATGAGTGTSWGDAFTDLQDALAAAASGDAVWVAEGTYTPGPIGDVDATFSLSSGVGLYGGFAGVATDTSLAEADPASFPTRLSGDLGYDDFYIDPTQWNINTANSMHVVTASGVDSTARLDGFTMIAGYATSASGGGLYAIAGSPTLSRCVFERNLASFSGGGGGVYVQDGILRAESCVFVENYVHMGKGGAIHAAGSGCVLLSDCAFSSNQVVGCSSEAAGGAVSLSSTLPSRFVRCDFTGNLARNFFPAGCSMTAWGGAIHNFSGPMILEACTFSGNQAHAGGAISNWANGVLLVNCLLSENIASAYDVGAGSVGGYGGAIANLSFQPYATTLVNCSLVQNTAGEAAGVASYWSHETIVQNSILWGNLATGQEVTLLGAQIKGAFTASTSCIEGLLQPIPGEDPPDSANFPGCIDQDPLLISLVPPDAHLRPGSPCIDAGDNFALPAWVLEDLEGNLRFADDPATIDGGIGTPPIVDMGAYEYGSGAVTSVRASGAAGDGPSPGLLSSRLLAYPNPTRGSVTFEYRLASGGGAGGATLEVFDIAGRRRFEAALAGPASYGSIGWNGIGSNGRPVGPGVYFARLRSGNATLVRRIDLVR